MSFKTINGYFVTCYVGIIISFIYGTFGHFDLCFFLGPKMQRHTSLNNGKFDFPMGCIFGSRIFSGGIENKENTALEESESSLWCFLSSEKFGTKKLKSIYIYINLFCVHNTKYKQIPYRHTN